MRANGEGETTVRLTRFSRLCTVNEYLPIEEDGFILIDTGIGGREGTMSAATRDHDGIIRRVALSHVHVVHIGSPYPLHSALFEAPLPTVDQVPADSAWRVGRRETQAFNQGMTRHVA